MEEIKTIYCDFDGTITKKDVVNTFFEKYADPKWLESEELWIDGKITSQENAIAQVGLLSNVTQKELDEFLNSIELDDYFKEFLRFIKEKNINFVILSDGFDLFIDEILKRNGVSNISVFANHLVYENNNFRIEFPYHNSKCDIGAGMCKCLQINEDKFCYIGDGTSDLCVAQKADILFATKSLERHCKNKAINYYPFKSFKDIIEVLNNS